MFPKTLILLSLLALLALSGCASSFPYLSSVPGGYTEELDIGIYEDSYRQGYQEAMEEAQDLSPVELREKAFLGHDGFGITAVDEDAYQKGYQDAMFEAQGMSERQMRSGATWGPDEIPEP